MARLVGGKYRLLRVIGRGGMGEVWSAENTSTHARVAVKLLGRARGSKEVAERFRQEAKLAAQLSHRNVVRIFDLVEERDGTLALVMEQLRGETLESSLARGPLEPAAVLAIALPILSALEQAHAHGVVHRDLKPSNLFLSVDPDGHVEPKLLDFGIAKPKETSVHTLDGQALGTPEYMSPEQIRDAPDIDGKSDLFSLAVVLVEAMTGEHPFRVPTASARISAVLETAVDPHPRIPPRIWQVLVRALSKRAYERPASAAAFRESLEQATEQTAEERASALRSAVVVSELEDVSIDVGPSPKPRMPNRLLIGGLAAVAGVAVAIIVALAIGSPARSPSPIIASPVTAVSFAEPAVSVMQAQSANRAAPSVSTPLPRVEPKGTVRLVSKPTASGVSTAKPVATTPGF